MRSPKNTVVRNSDIAWQRIQEKIVLVSPKTMRIHILHGTGERIWEHLKAKRNEEELAALISEEYDTSLETARKDVKAFLDKLKKEGLVIPGV